MALTPRGKALRHLKKHRGITENPANSNTDNRPNADDGRYGIRKAQQAAAGGAEWLVGTPWCGEWARWALQQGGVQGLSARQASVLFIEADARAGRAPFTKWHSPSEWRKVLRGSLVVMFGAGVHVETVRSFKRTTSGIVVVTEGGNTSSGTAGSQANGGGAYRRERALSDVHGFAQVHYPGQRKHHVPTLAMPSAHSASVSTDVDKVPVAPESDAALLKALRKAGPEAKATADELATLL